MKKELLRKLPKIDELLKEECVVKVLNDGKKALITDTLRETIEEFRNAILKDEIDDFSKEDIMKLFFTNLEKKKQPNLKKVVNATGIVIHTNLGRSILCKDAIYSVIMAAEHYNNLEYNLEEGKRGSRYSHIEKILREITGAEAALVVNNNAAAVMLVLNTLCEDKEAIVSRGQLVEIGGSFRVPEVMKFSRAKLVEVGTTNRTHLYDYESSINEDTGVILKVHTSNFKIMGFTEEVPLEDMIALGKEHSIPVIEDIGSGVLIDLSKYGFTYEPTVQDSIEKGVDVVTFSGDKLLGGPQAGIIVGKKEYIERIKKNQLTRALRIDKMTLAALEATLKCYLDEKEAVESIPTLNMILCDKAELKKKAQGLKRRLKVSPEHFNFTIAEDYSMVGGGSMPTEKIESYVLKVKSSKYSAKQIEEALRGNSIPIVTRVCNDEVIIDMRTLLQGDLEIIVDAFKKMGEI